MSSRIIGILVFVVAALAVVGYTVFQSDDENFLTALLRGAPDTEAMGYIGGEKRNFMGNLAVQEILQDRYGLTVDARRAGSLEMVTDRALISQDPDFYWPASQVSRELARTNGINPVQSEIIFNSPIVLYSWSPVAQALVDYGIARPLTDGEAAFAVDTVALLDLVLNEAAWGDVGVDQLHGSVIVFSTNPLRSNSGNQFASLITQVLAGGETAGPDLEEAVRRVAGIYRRMGYLESSSSTLFEQYLRQGMGAYPLVAGYESQLIEFAAADVEQWTGLEGRDTRPVVLYPEPTVYSSHILMATTDSGRALVEALQDPELQDIAWSRHGFRSGFSVTSDPSILPVSGIPDAIDKVEPMPPFGVVERLLNAIEQIQG